MRAGRRGDSEGRAPARSLIPQEEQSVGARWSASLRAGVSAFQRGIAVACSCEGLRPEHLESVREQGSILTTDGTDWHGSPSRHATLHPSAKSGKSVVLPSAFFLLQLQFLRVGGIPFENRVNL